MTTPLAGRGNPAAALLVTACFLTAPFVAFLAHNVDAGIDAWQVLRYPAVGLVPLVTAVLAIWLFISRSAADRAAVTLAAVLVAFFNYGALSAFLESIGLPTPVRLLIWLVVATLIAAVGFAWSRHQSLIRFLSIAGLVMIALPLLPYLASARANVPLTESVDPPRDPSFESAPDIYYIVPDAYGRADFLEDEFGFDNSTFLDALRGRGFRIEEDALSHYPVTYLSMAATLDMDYVVEPSEDALRGGRRPFYDRLRGGSTLHRRLEIEGYKHVSAPPGTWSGTECSGVEDLCIEPVSRRWLGGLLGEVEWELAHLTPVGEVIDVYFTDSFQRPFADPSHAVRTVLQADLNAPAFVQIHLMQSHTPFIFDRDCRPTPPETHNLRRWARADRMGYIEAIECTNKQILNAVDLMDDDAIVVILADHGPAFTLGLTTPFEQWTDRTLRERYSVLHAYRLPRACQDMPPASPVNVFRVIIACLEDTEPKLLPDRWFFSGYMDEPEVREMTGPPWRPAGASRAAPAP